ncbi:MAG: aminomethyl-transferring glycine dehydrogenase subunit GcvPB, partial [Parachlamydia sp.]|nr:aminomethyl-transferring glycine dehydrogenase subunit GcvPB [Parachlamydia sp.]
AFEPPSHLMRKSSIALPEVSEIDLTRHFSSLARKSMGIDTHFYPLGSCTMKFNPRVNEWAASLPKLTATHPLAPEEMVQGNLQIIFELLQWLCELTGMQAGTLLPNAGAQGEFVGLQLIHAYHRSRQDLKRKEVLIPDSAHGTNAATAAMAGLTTIPIRSSPEGDLDLDHLKAMVSERTAALMLTNPNTLGLFSPSTMAIADIVHRQGGLLYYDGANLNPLLHIARPAEMGFDVMHVNLHKTFSTPHGGGGPGSGPVLCREILKPFLPLPRIDKTTKGYTLIHEDPSSIGRIASFHGNFGIYLRAYLYIRLHGHYGLRRIAEQSVLNANYLKKLLGSVLTIPFSQPCLHEFVLQADRFLDKGVRALDIAKRLLDYGFYAPTIYFPLTVKECMLVEPTESESKATLDSFAEAMQKIAEECETQPDLVKTAPHTLTVSRLDETRAARHPVLRASICN